MVMKWLFSKQHEQNVQNRYVKLSVMCLFDQEMLILYYYVIELNSLSIPLC